MRNAWIFLSVVALVGCSKKGAPEPAAGSAGSAVAAGSATASTGSAAAPAGSAAAASGCAILKSDEAARLAGGPVEDGKESNEEGVGCLYNGKTNGDDVAVNVYPGDGTAKYESLKSSEDEPVELPGVGDHAYRTKNSGSIAVVAHGRCAVITLSLMNPKTPKPAPDVITDVAKAVASRL